MQRGGARRDRDGMFRPDDDGEIFFKRIEIRTRRRDPIGLEGFQDVFDFSAPHIWWRKVNSVFVHKMVKMVRVTGAAGETFRVTGLGHRVPGTGSSGSGTGAGCHLELSANT
jgi:hypothetical protein